MVLTASETRKQARESLKGKWGVVVLITLIFLGYSFLVGLLSAIPFLGFLVSIAAIVIDIPIIYGFMMTMMKLNLILMSQQSRFTMVKQMLLINLIFQSKTVSSTQLLNQA